MRSNKQQQHSRDVASAGYASRTAKHRRPAVYERETIEEFRARTGKDITKLDPVSRDPEAAVVRAQRAMAAERKGVVR